MSTIILTRGIPGSGKSTYAKEWVREDPHNRVRLNRDDLRRTLYATTETRLTFEQEKFVSVVEKNAARAALQSGKDVIVDAMNLNPAWVAAWMRMGFPVEFRDFPVELDEALDRNAQREHPIPEKVIRDLHARYVANSGFPATPVNVPGRGGFPTHRCRA